MQDPPRLSFRQPMFGNVDAWRGRRAGAIPGMLLGPGGAATPVAATAASTGVRWACPSSTCTGNSLRPAHGSPGAQAGRRQRQIARHRRTARSWRQQVLRAAEDHAHVEGSASGDAAAPGAILRRRGLGQRTGPPRLRGAGARCFHVRQPAHAPGRLPANIRNNMVEANPEADDEIERYNQFAGNHEHIIAKSLFSAGMTWPGVFVFDDQRALDYLASRPDVDATRVGCAGLSGGGLRTVMLTGADERIRCSCCVGMMTTWRDYLLNKCYTHTWMCYVPGLPRDLDYPEILGLAAPIPCWC